MKKIIISAFATVLVLCSLCACAKNPEKEILGKWYNKKGDCLEILSDNTYSVDKIYRGHDIGINKGEWEYLQEENIFKFHANTYSKKVITVEIVEDEKGACIEYTYYGTFYKDQAAEEE